MKVLTVKVLRQRLRFYGKRLRFIFIGLTVGWNFVPLLLVGHPLYFFARDVAWLMIALLMSLGAWDAFTLWRDTRELEAGGRELLGEMRMEAKKNLAVVRMITGQKYVISSNGQAILCLQCGATSHHPMDVKNRYCANCEMFLEAPA